MPRYHSSSTLLYSTPHCFLMVSHALIILQTPSHVTPQKSLNLGRSAPCTYFATPSSALKQSSNCLLCLFAACSVSSLRFVVLWKVWKHVLHLTVWAAEFYIRLIHVLAKLEVSLYYIARHGDHTDFSCDLASLGPASPLRSRFCCALHSC